MYTCELLTSKKHHFIGTVTKFNRKIVQKQSKSISPNTNILYDRSLSWLCTGTSIKRCSLMLVL